jgi:hypothetical protein
MEAMEKAKRLITTENAQAEFTGFLIRLRAPIERMPTSLSAKVNPTDPDHALEQLTRWVDDLFKTLSTAPSVLP